MEPKNIKQFKTLVERYESITLEEIIYRWEFINDGEIIEKCRLGHVNAYNLTGFGDTKTCKLCEASKGDCTICIYNKGITSITVNCNNGNNMATYNNISGAKTPQQLLKAFRARAKHLRESYPQYLNQS